MAARRVPLLAALIVVCSAISDQHDVQRLRRTLQRRHHEWMDGCKSSQCWSNLWDKIYNEDKDISLCRETALPAFKACLRGVVDSPDVCTCGFKQLQRDMDKLDDDLICERELRPPAYYGYTPCDDARAEACRQKMEAFWTMTDTYPRPSVAARKRALAEADACLAEVRDQKVSTVGCSHAFPWAGSMDATRGAAAGFIFAQGCDDVKSIYSNCAPPDEITVESCNGRYYEVDAFLSCAKEKVDPTCYTFVDDAAPILKKAKRVACNRLDEVRAKLERWCVGDVKRRQIIWDLLDLLKSNSRR